MRFLLLLLAATLTNAIVYKNNADGSGELFDAKPINGNYVSNNNNRNTIEFDLGLSHLMDINNEVVYRTVPSAVVNVEVKNKAPSSIDFDCNGDQYVATKVSGKTYSFDAAASVHDVGLASVQDKSLNCEIVTSNIVIDGNKNTPTLVVANRDILKSEPDEWLQLYNFTDVLGNDVLVTYRQIGTCDSTTTKVAYEFHYQPSHGRLMAPLNNELILQEPENEVLCILAPDIYVSGRNQFIDLDNSIAIPRDTVINSTSKLLLDDFYYDLVKPVVDASGADLYVWGGEWGSRYVNQFVDTHPGTVKRSFIDQPFVAPCSDANHATCTRTVLNVSDPSTYIFSPELAQIAADFGIDASEGIGYFACDPNEYANLPPILYRLDSALCNDYDCNGVCNNNGFPSGWLDDIIVGASNGFPFTAPNRDASFDFLAFVYSGYQVACNVFFGPAGLTTPDASNLFRTLRTLDPIEAEELREPVEFPGYGEFPSIVAQECLNADPFTGTGSNMPQASLPQIIRATVGNGDDQFEVFPGTTFADLEDADARRIHDESLANVNSGAFAANHIDFPVLLVPDIWDGFYGGDSGIFTFPGFWLVRGNAHLQDYISKGYHAEPIGAAEHFGSMDQPDIMAAITWDHMLA